MSKDCDHIPVVITETETVLRITIEVPNHPSKVIPLLHVFDWLESVVDDWNDKATENMPLSELAKLLDGYDATE